MAVRPEGFPKSSRLLCRKDFRFRPYSVFSTEDFRVLYTSSGHGRMGISISKKALKTAPSRNRVRRLLKEGFRKKQREFKGLDVNWVGKTSLRDSWKSLDLQGVARQMEAFLNHCTGDSR